jgi:hypothetical protein
MYIYIYLDILKIGSTATLPSKADQGADFGERLPASQGCGSYMYTQHTTHTSIQLYIYMYVCVCVCVCVCLCVCVCTYVGPQGCGRLLYSSPRDFRASPRASHLTLGGIENVAAGVPGGPGEFVRQL